jgi:hypothetical protein
MALTTVQVRTMLQSLPSCPSVTLSANNVLWKVADLVQNGVQVSGVKQIFISEFWFKQTSSWSMKTILIWSFQKNIMAQSFPYRDSQHTWSTDHTGSSLMYLYASVIVRLQTKDHRVFFVCVLCVLRLTTVGDPPRWPCDTPLSTKVDTKFRRQVAVAQSV